MVCHIGACTCFHKGYKEIINSIVHKGNSNNHMAMHYKHIYNMMNGCKVDIVLIIVIPMKRGSCNT